MSDPTRGSRISDNLIKTIPAAEAFRPLGAGGCPLAKK